MPPTKRIARTPIEDDEAPPIAPGPRMATAPAPVETGGEVEAYEEPGTLQIRRGFSAARQVADSTSSFAQNFKLTDQIQIVKFLEDEPYASYTRHWIERMGTNGQKTLRTFNCLKNWGKPCPVCEAGDKSSANSAFNIALIGDDGVPLLKSWDAGPKILNILENYARDPKVAPLTKGYFLASKSGKMGTVNYQIVPIKAHSLTDDYDIDPPTPEELGKLELYTAEIVTMPKMKDMLDIAAEIADYD